MGEIWLRPIRRARGGVWFGLLGALLCGVNPANAAVIAYERFDYASSKSDSSTLSSNPAANGGAGFSGAWNGNHLFRTAGLTHPELNVAGGRAQTVSGATASFRDLDLSSQAGKLDANSKIGKDGTTVWLRMLVNMESTLEPPASPPGWAGLSFFDGNSERLFMGKRNNNPNWGFERSGQSGGTVSTGVGVASPVLLLVKVDFSLGSDLVSMWAFSGATPETLPVANGVLNANDFSFNRIRISSGNGAALSVDEVYLAWTFDELFPAPIPEPSSAFLVMLGIVFIRVSRQIIVKRGRVS